MAPLVKKYGAISVFYTDPLDGGGADFGQDYIPVVKQLFGKVDRIFEFCAGPAFIGFSLLAHGLCRSLCLSDINPAAVAAAQRTVRHNSLQDVVSVYESDGLAQIPEHETWDLVVSNPPHFKDQYPGSLRHHDPAWTIHKNFYSGVKRHLKPGGSTLIQENFEGSDEDDFSEMITSGGLICDRSFMWADRARTGYLDTYYYISCRRIDDGISDHSFPKNNLIDCRQPALVKDIPLTKDGIPLQIRLEPFRRYRFRFLNDLHEDVMLLTFKRKFGLSRFLRPFGSATADSERLSFAFHFYPGKYLLKDAKSRRTLVQIVVS